MVIFVHVKAVELLQKKRNDLGSDTADTGRRNTQQCSNRPMFRPHPPGPSAGQLISRSKSEDDRDSFLCDIMMSESRRLSLTPERPSVSSVYLSKTIGAAQW